MQSGQLSLVECKCAGLFFGRRGKITEKAINYLIKLNRNIKKTGFAPRQI